MDESGAIQTQPLGYIKMCVAVIKLLRLKSLTFGGHLKERVFLKKEMKKLEFLKTEEKIEDQHQNLES